MKQTGGACLLAMLLFQPLGALASEQSDGAYQIPPPPPILPTLPEDVLLTQLSEQERAIVARARDARARFQALLDVSDTRLATAQSLAGSRDSVYALQLYEAVLLAADRRLRSSEARVPPRDRLYKRFERRIAKQIDLLKPIVDALPIDHHDTGVSISESIERLRIAAFNSAIDVDTNVLKAPGDTE